MNMVSESDLPGRSPVRCRMLQPARERQDVPVMRLGQYLKHAEQLHDSFSRPGRGRKCRSGREVGVAAEGQHIQGNIFTCGHDLRGKLEI